MIKKIFFLIFFIPLVNINAQVNDAALWSEIELEKRINLRSTISLSENLRLIENWTQISTHFTQLTYKVDVFSNFNIATSVRLAQRFKYDETRNNRGRFMLDLNYEKKIKQIAIQFRQRYQIQYQDPIKSNWTDKVSTLRSKLGIELDLKNRFKPYFSGEIFIEDYALLNNLRFSLGTNFRINKKINLDLAYIISKEIQQNNPKTFYVLNTSVKYLF